MPLARVQVRNEFGLGQPELYTEVDREDPKAVLDGLAVAGLVGILRQLGDLAEFASDVFHGLQEEVMNACSRSHKLKVRVQRIEAAFPPLEKAILAQKSHLHLAYTAGSNWHARLHNERNHFISGDLPHFIMDCYEECRDPPRFHLLDKFDTGGPGSCLKRYSDPTFFRRASTGSGEANLDKLSKERKSSRSKKKRTRKRKEICRGGSISNLSGRTQFASFEANSHLSPSQTPSSLDGTFIPDRRGQSNSLDSTAGSGYIDCVFRPTYSMKTEEYEDTIDSASLREHSTILDQSPPSSSCVTWDEKMEILEAESYKYDHEESTEKLQMHSREESMENPEKTVHDLTSESQEMGGGDFRNKDHLFIASRENQEKESDDFGTIGQMGHHQFDDQDKATSVSVQNQVDDFGTIGQMGHQTHHQFDDLDKATSVSVQNQVDDVESEPETFEDALNSIESESETDVECQTKREVEHSNSIDNRRLDEIQVVDHWKTKPSNTESQELASSNTSNEWTSANEPRFSVAEKSLHVASESLITIHERNVEVSGSNIESSSTSAESSPLVRRTNEKVTNSCDSQKSSNAGSGIQPVKLWTNGGLLGLEPSKPPDFSVAKQDAVTSNGGGPSNTDQDVKKSNTLFECISSEISSRSNDSSQRFSPAEMVAKREKYGDSPPSNGLYRDHRHSLGETFEETPDAKSMSNGITRQKSNENASLLFGIGNRLSLNGSQRDEKSRDTNAFEKRSEDQSAAYKPYSGKGYFGNGSLFNSPSSSPPLQHMKISVQPVNGCDTSKLKLKFPDGSYCHDGSEDMLLSFQLVPESATHHQHENYSDSDDDDTFCRSSPYMSDDCLSHHSESNSDQWESDYTPSNENNTIVYDSFRKPSSTDSVLRSSDFEGEGCESIHFGYIENGGSQQSVEIPSLSTVNPLFEQEMARGFDVSDVQSSHFSEELAPLPPPLPPAQWCVAKAPSDVNVSKKETVSEAISYISDAKIVGSTIPPAQWCVAKTPSDVNVGKKETVSEAISYISDAKIVGSTIPPAQWCVAKTPSDVNVSKKETVSEAVSYVSEAKIVGSTIPPPPRPKPSLNEKPTETDKATALKPEKKQVEWQKSDGGREASKAVNGRGTNEKDDFLHQIRTKAFSLRRITTDKPVAAVVSPGPTAHGGQVTAILEKANAIRQAVGSDNGDDDDDDNWSE